MGTTTTTMRRLVRSDLHPEGSAGLQNPSSRPASRLLEVARAKEKVARAMVKARARAARARATARASQVARASPVARTSPRARARAKNKKEKIRTSFFLIKKKKKKKKK